ncbi:hypothetical protein [Flavobacterium oreochromis]|nr:hypothetical protein [Flavobacterium oreochromis]
MRAFFLQFISFFSIFAYMSKEQRFEQRNAYVRDLFYKTMAKYPKWRVECVIEEVASKVFLSERTVNAIISHEGIYGGKQKKNTQDPNQILMAF